MTSATAPTPAGHSGSALRAIITNVTSSWASMAVNVLVSLFMAPFVVRHLGDVEYGIWTLLVQFTGYLWLFDFGVRESVVKYVAEYSALDKRERLSSTVHAAVTIYGIISVLVMIACGGMIAALPAVFNIPADHVSEARLTLLFTGATIAQAFVFNVYVGVLKGLQQFYVVTRLGLLVTLVRASLTVAALSAGYGLVALGVIQFGLTFGMSLLTYRLALRRLPYIGIRLGRPDAEQLRRIAHYAKYVLVNNIGEKLVYASDALVVGAFLPIASLTYYSVGGTLLTQFRTFIASMGVVLGPMTSVLDARKDEDGLRRLFLSSAKAAVTVGLPACIAFILLGHRFLDLWMGPPFGERSGPILLTLAFAHMAGLPYTSITEVLYGVARHRIIAIVRLIEAAANVTLSIVLVHQVGLIGVALGTLIPQVVIVLVVLPLALPRFIPLSLSEYYFSTYGRPLLASIPYWGLCLFIDRVVQPASLIAFMLSIAACLPVYAVAVWFIVFSAEERQAVQARLQRRVRVPRRRPVESKAM